MPGDLQARLRLKAAARHYCSGGGAGELAEDAAALGLPPPPVEDTALTVLPENWDALQLFLGCQTQWRHGPSGHRTGLDYAGCQAAAAADGIDWQTAINGLRVLEREILVVE